MAENNCPIIVWLGFDPFRPVHNHKLRALRAGHLSTSELRFPWTLEEKHRHEVNGHAEYDKRCEICVNEWNFQTPTSSVLRVLRVRLRECHFQRV